jgi:CDP-diacylglycerol---serine O-phosphatidyltransferase
MPGRIFRLRRQGAPRRRPRIPRLAFPSTFTLLNLLSGFYAVIMTAQGNFVGAAWLIAAAGLFDVLDGMMARLVDGTSAFGVELDSLADIVSFGVAPSFLLYQFGLYELGLAGVIVAALPAICGSVRLARFNVTFEEKKPYFEGLPIPAQAATVVAFILVFDDALWFDAFDRGRLSVLITLVVTLSVLMVSTVRFDTLPIPTPRLLRTSPRKALAFFIGVLLIIFLQEIGLLLTLLAYLAHGIGRALLWAFRTATAEGDGDALDAVPYEERLGDIPPYVEPLDRTAPQDSSSSLFAPRPEDAPADVDRPAGSRHEDDLPSYPKS